MKAKPPIKTSLFNILPLILLLALLPRAAQAGDSLDACNVTWTEFAKDSQDSMPVGNGDIGLNVWTEENGDILFYIGKTDAWSENGLVKVGRVRVSLKPNPFTAGGFSQTLKLRQSEIVLTGGGATVRVWVDANAPVIRVEAKTAQPSTMFVALDPWRTEAKNNVSADVLLPRGQDRLAWYHSDAASHEPNLKGRIFGAVALDEGLRATSERTLQSTSARTSSSLAVYPLTTVGLAPAEWTAKAYALSETRVDIEEARAKHLKWWADFWNRSHIFLTGDADAAKVTQGYTLDRYVEACSQRGAYPMKFNGSIFVDDNPTNTARPKGTTMDLPAPMDADTRAWGPQYWFQNTRPMYWPRLMAGDFDLMQPLFQMYAEIVRSNAASVKQYYNHAGSYMAETAPFWGGIPNIDPAKPGSYTKHYFTPVLELAAMELDYYAYTGDKALVRNTLIPMISAGLTFFSEHFPRDAQGKLLLDQDNSIEMYWKVRNPLPDIAGLRYVIGRLLEMPDDLVDSAHRQQWTALQAILPELPMGMKDGKEVLLPYEANQPVAPKHNTENPELYAVYPFRLYGLGKPNLDVALNTFDIRLNKRTGCWYQDPVQAAYLGLTDLAQKDTVSDLTHKDKLQRFPAFWDRSHDYVPDEDNGGNGENALQLMLMQCDGRRILLLPSWPRDWEADFKLHAPFETVVEGHVKDGKVTALQVTPESRKADVVMPPPN